MSLLAPGQTCWRVEAARRLAFLADNQAYYAALAEAVEAAQHSIWILGWAFDPRTRLAPDGREGPNDPDEIGEILLRLSRAKPDLDVRLLIWRSALSHNNSHAWLEHRARKTFKGSAVQYREDGLTPLGACHHQKVVVIDGQIAFCGGGDIVTNRWDTLGHVHGDPRRILPHLARHAPRHEVTMLVEGAAAGALADLFQARWARATGTLAPHKDGQASWPANQPAHLSETMVGIARTEPALAGASVVDEILQLHLAAIAGARQTIYLENQYFTSQRICRALAERLSEEAGPEVILVLPRRSPSWFDRLTMDTARAPQIWQLAAADRFDRLRIYSPLTSEGEGIIVHAKVSIFDDELVCVGSANLNNRSEGFDTECELALHGQDDLTRREVAQLRDVLIAHYLSVAEDVFSRERFRTGRVIDAIEALNGAGRLAPLKVQCGGWWDDFIARHQLGDPADVSQSWRFNKRGPASRVGAALLHQRSEETQ